MSELMQILIGIKPPFHIPDGLARIVTFETEDDKDDKDDIQHYCPKCMRWMHIESFYIRSDGRAMSWCKSCQKAHKKAQKGKK